MPIGITVTRDRGYNIRRAARVLGVCPTTLRREIKKGSIPAARIGTHYYVQGKDLAAYWKSKGGGELFCKDAGGRVSISGRAVKYMQGIITIG